MWDKGFSQDGFELSRLTNKLAHGSAISSGDNLNLAVQPKASIWSRLRCVSHSPSAAPDGTDRNVLPAAWAHQHHSFARG